MHDIITVCDFLEFVIEIGADEDVIVRVSFKDNSAKGPTHDFNVVEVAC